MELTAGLHRQIEEMEQQKVEDTFGPNPCTSMKFLSRITGDWIAVPCGRKRCVHCGPRKKFHLNNVLIMEYVGTDEEPARPLKEGGTSDPAGELAWALDSIERMATGARLVHSDFSEYNILRHPGSGDKVIIDVAQSVVLDHPSSYEFLVRDISNITRYFVRAGADDGPDPREAASAVIAKAEKEKRPA